MGIRNHLVVHCSPVLLWLSAWHVSCQCLHGDHQIVNTVSQRQILTSPNHPLPYLSNVNCTWLLMAESKVDKVKVEVVSLDLDLTPRCLNDSLDLYDGQDLTPESRLLQLCGSHIGNSRTVQSNGHAMLVNFLSGQNGHQRHGFTLAYWSILNLDSDEYVEQNAQKDQFHVATYVIAALCGMVLVIFVIFHFACQERPGRSGRSQDGGEEGVSNPGWEDDLPPNYSDLSIHRQDSNQILSLPSLTDLTGDEIGGGEEEGGGGGGGDGSEVNPGRVRVGGSSNRSERDGGSSDRNEIRHGGSNTTRTDHGIGNGTERDRGTQNRIRRDCGMGSRTQRNSVTRRDCGSGTGRDGESITGIDNVSSTGRDYENGNGRDHGNGTGNDHGTVTRIYHGNGTENNSMTGNETDRDGEAGNARDSLALTLPRNISQESTGPPAYSSSMIINFPPLTPPTAPRSSSGRPDFLLRGQSTDSIPPPTSGTPPPSPSPRPSVSDSESNLSVRFT